MSEEHDAGGKVTRRALLTGAGAAVAGLSLSGATAAVAAPAGAPLGQVGVAPEDQDALELQIKIDQAGPDFTTYGYLTRSPASPTPRSSQERAGTRQRRSSRSSAPRR